MKRSLILSLQQVRERRPSSVGLVQINVAVLFACAAVLSPDFLCGEDLPRPSAKQWPNAHAHNDYLHPHPLQDALDHGFCSVEADVFLQDGELLVGHEREELQPTRTLESLYLAPLRERVRVGKGHVHAAEVPFFLLIDIKTEGKSTYEVVHAQLAKYGDLFSSREGEVWKPRAVTAVISGNVPRQMMLDQTLCYAGIDGRPDDLSSSVPPHVMPWISANWSLLYRWRGEGPIPESEQQRLRQYVHDAHAKGRLVRFWATPENPVLWRELRDQQVDLIGTDKLQKLEEFFEAQSRDAVQKSADKPPK